MGAENPGQAQDLAGIARCRERSADGRPDADVEGRSRPGLTIWIHSAGDRRHALRRVRPTPDRTVFHAAVELLRDHGGDAIAAGRSSDARQDFHALADDQWRGTTFGIREVDYP